MKILIADIETTGLLPDLKTRDNIHCLAIKEYQVDPISIYADHPGYRSLSEGISRLARADLCVFHNGLAFDRPAIIRFFGEAVLPVERVYDTLLASRFRHSEKRSHSLSALGEELGFPKGEHSDFSCFSADMAAYCKRDVEVTEAVFADLYRDEFPESLKDEHLFAHVMHLQEQHGFRIDLEKAEGLAAEFRQEIRDIEDQLVERWEPKVIERWSDKTGRRLKDKIEPFNPGSRKMIGERLIEDYGWKPKKYTATGLPKVDEKILETLDYPEAKQLSRYFRLQKMLGQLSDGNSGWLQLERDGRVHGRVNTIGTATHRCSHWGPNMAQVDKKDERMRQVWIADEGQVLVGCDADALELVCLAHYLAFWDEGAYADALVHGDKEDGTDVHSRTQKLCELPTRDNAKTMQYAYLYGASDRKLAQIARESGGAVQDGKEIRSRMNEGITGLGKLSDAIRKRSNAGWFKSIDGRQISIKSEHSALNFLLQSTGAIVMKKALIVFHYDLAVKAGFVVDGYPVNFNYVANVHDEVQLSVCKERADEVGQLFADSITEAAKRLGMKCPLSGTYAIGNNWWETH